MPTAYPEDSFDNMKLFAAAHGFAFPYLYDEDQTVARAYGAVCTPDFFGFNSESRRCNIAAGSTLAQGGRTAGARRDLFEAMKQVARTGNGPQDQIASIGCSIKWKEAA